MMRIGTSWVTARRGRGATGAAANLRRWDGTTPALACGSAVLRSTRLRAMTTDLVSAGRVLRPGFPLALGAFALYSVGMALGWLITDNAFDETDQVLADMWWVIAILCVLMWGVVALAGLRVQRSRRVGWLAWFLIVPLVVSLLGAGLVFSDPGTDWANVAFVLGATLLVGIGEETAFRGIVLNSLATRMSVAWAVVGSSVLFGLYHGINVMIRPVGDTLVQMVLAAVTGVLLGFIYAMSGGNLVLVIVLHWIFDFRVIGPLAADGSRNGLDFVVPVMVLGSVVAVVAGFRRLGAARWPATDLVRQ